MQAVAQHMQKYPDFLSEGGKYQIPKDHYDKIIANKLPTYDGEFSLRQWQEVHNFFAANNIEVSQLEPSILEYSEVQRDAIAVTLDNEKNNLKYINFLRQILCEAT